MPHPSWLDDYIERGFKLIYWPREHGKGPHDKDWQKREYNLDEFDETKHNIGVLLGSELRPGRFLVDIDFDWTEGGPLSNFILPEAPTFVFGRPPSRPTSHIFYTTSKPFKKVVYVDINDPSIADEKKITFVEMRGTKNDGTIGNQTMLPPSVHPETGEVLQIRSNAPIHHDDSIPHRVMLYAIACILYKYLGHRGMGHDPRLAIAGFLLLEGLDEDSVIMIGRAIAKLSANNMEDVSTTVHTTASHIRAGDAVKGKAALIKFIGGDKDKTGKAVVSRIREWMGGGEFLHDEKDRIYKDNQENIRRALTKLDINLTFNQFANIPMIKYNGYEGRLEDHMQDQVWLDIDSRFQFRPTREFFGTVIASVARHNPFHPIKDYLGSLQWDGIPRLDTWLIDYAGAADSEYARAVSSMVLIAAVRRVNQPGCKFDELMVLESEQGLFKSSALKSLCKNEEWFTDDLPLNVDSKIIIERTAGKWIIEAADLSGMRSSQVEQLKALLSRQIDAARLSYGRLLSEVPRQWIVIGTTNAHVYLKDITGNRRFWPMRIKQFDVEALRRIRDQLWAEAAVREMKDESIRLSPHLYSFAEMQQERRREEDPWEETIKRHFDGIKRQAITISELWELVHVSVDRRTTTDQKRLSDIMTKLQFKKGHVRPLAGGDPARGWKKGKEQELLEFPEEN